MNDDQSILDQSPETSPSRWRSRRPLKMLAMYMTMVTVSTFTIYMLEHASLFSAFRTALVAAVGKTVAANWVSGIFD